MGRWGLAEVYYRWEGVREHFSWMGWGECRYILVSEGWVGVRGSIFLVSSDALTFFMGRWGWVEVYFGWVRVCGSVFWVSGSKWKFFIGGWG